MQLHLCGRDSLSEMGAEAEETVKLVPLLAGKGSAAAGHVTFALVPNHGGFLIKPKPLTHNPSSDCAVERGTERGDKSQMDREKDSERERVRVCMRERDGDREGWGGVGGK